MTPLTKSFQCQGCSLAPLIKSYLIWNGKEETSLKIYLISIDLKKIQVAQTFTSWLVTRDGTGSGWRLTACKEIPTLHSIQSGQAYFCSLISLWLLAKVGGSELMKVLKVQLLQLNFSIVIHEDGLENVIESLQLSTQVDMVTILNIAAAATTTTARTKPRRNDPWRTRIWSRATGLKDSILMCHKAIYFSRDSATSCCCSSFSIFEYHHQEE